MARRAFWPNFLALSVAGGAAWFLHTSFDPDPAGTVAAELRSERVNVAVLDSVAVPSTAPMREGTRPGEDLQESSQANHASTGMASDKALLLELLLLERGQLRFADIPTYTATFHKRERIDGELQDLEVTRIKVRHEPFSVYMKWIVGDKGQELLYVDGENDDKILVKLGGLKGRLLPAVKVDPYGSQAKSQSRHPITDCLLYTSPSQRD